MPGIESRDFSLEHATTKLIASSESAKPGDFESQLNAAVAVLSQGLAILDSLGLSSAAAHISLGIETAMASENLIQNKLCSED